MAKPANMKQSAWEYLLKFTSNHEGVVLHMYNNKRAAGENNDVTCGIGFANMPNKESSLQYLDMFYDKDTGQPATREQLMPEKLLAHRVLFWNAARIWEQNLDYEWLPQKTKPPELLPWKPWTRNVYDLDSNTSDAERHDVAPAQPSTAR